MPDLASKNGWTWVAFGDLVKRVSESGVPNANESRTYIGLEHLDPKSLAINVWGSDVPLKVPKTRIRKGDVLFARRNTHLRRCAVAPFDTYFSPDGYAFRSKSVQLSQDLLVHLVASESFMSYAIEHSAGTHSKRVKWSDLAKYKFALPPMEEQRRIASACSAASYLAEITHELKATGKQARKSLIFALYQRGTRGEELKRTPIGSVPMSWEVAPLGERYEVQLGKMMSEAARGGPNQVPYLRNANVQWNRLDLEDVATMGFTDAEREKFRLRYGDVLACEGRHVGKSAIWRDEIPGACFQKALHRLRRLSDGDIPEYLLHCLQYFSWAGRFVAETGETTIPHLPAERLRAMLFPFPPVDQQREIAEAVLACDRADERLSDRIASIRALLRELQRGLDGR